jgi:Uma2 family endonuclease
MHMPTLRRRWTVDDLRDLPDDGNRYEVIDGELFVTPAPTLKHQRAAWQLAQLIDAYLAHERVGEVILAPADVTFSRVRTVQPDVFVIPFVDGKRAERFEDVGRLLLAVEVLSQSTARADRVSKRVMFREEGVAEYWVVDLDARAIERSTPADSRIDVVVEQLEWTPVSASVPLLIDLPSYFARVLDD